jgi:signal-transduction protein with cAMP-binding, CBS, and nucleotidyltransferase domain
MMLKMPPEKRTSDHIKLICVALRDHVPLFQEFPVNIQNSIAKVANLQEIEENRVIIRENQIAHNYYFIVSGVAAVYVLRKNILTREKEDFLLAYLSKGESFGVNILESFKSKENR